MTANTKTLSEDAFVQRYFAPLAQEFPGAHDLRDDAAYLSPPPGEHLVITTDTLIEGVHFLFSGEKEQAAYAARKALACNVSDLVAKGAKPLAYTMSLTLPKTPYQEWIDSFVGALSKAQDDWGLKLIGGDTTRHNGPLVLSITAFGTCAKDIERTRSRAKSNEIIFVSGTIGDARMGLGLLRNEHTFVANAGSLSEADRTMLLTRSRCPEPRIELIDALRNYATATIDISDGLVRDLKRLCRASGVGAEVHLNKIPYSHAVEQILNKGGIDREVFLTGGDDYEILSAVPEASGAKFRQQADASGCKVAAIGRLTASKDLRFLNEDNEPISFTRSGWDHFEDQD